MDHMMPKMDGIETTKHLRDMGYTNPIVALTANALVGQADIFLQSGFDGFISKPIDIRYLNDVLNEFIRDKQSPEVLEAARNQKVNNADENNDLRDDFLEAVSKIKGINTKVGLNLLSGMACMYQDAMKMFYNKLEEQYNDMAGFLTSDDLPSFAICVHGIKSQLATIGAVDLSETALKLETAAKAKNTKVCETLFPDFYEKLVVMREELSVIFPAATAAEKIMGDMELLKKNLEKARIAAAKYDNDSGISAIEPLIAFDYGESINKLLEAVIFEFNEFNCEKAEELINKIEI
jgi:HPt (histidine-containing phosphotransfer) domain-containing protein